MFSSRHRQSWQVCVSWTLGPAWLLSSFSSEGSPAPHPGWWRWCCRTSQPSEDEDQQLIWTDEVDFITLVADPEGAALYRPLSLLRFGLGSWQAPRTEATLFIPGFLSFYQVLFIFKHLFNLSCKMKTIASAAFYLSTGGVQADTHIKALGIFIIPDSVISSGVWQMHKSTTVSTWTLQWLQWLQTRIKGLLRKCWAFSWLNNHHLLSAWVVGRATLHPELGSSGDALGAAAKGWLWWEQEYPFNSSPALYQVTHHQFGLEFFRLDKDAIPRGPAPILF